MSAIKVLSIIGIVLAALSFLCLMGFNNVLDYEAAIGWGMIASLYLLAFSIVGVVSRK